MDFKIMPKLTPEQQKRMIEREAAHLKLAPKFSWFRYLISPFFNRRKYEKDAFTAEKDIIERFKKLKKMVDNR